MRIVEAMINCGGSYTEYFNAFSLVENILNSKKKRKFNLRCLIE